MILALAGPEQEREFRLGWSLWRRAHQAVARRCHRARRAFHPQSAPSSSVSPSVLRHVAMEARSIVPEPRIELLTDVAWELVKPLMPPQKPPSGRPRRNHRSVLGGMLWVLSTGSSWRELPEEEFGPWQTVYGRYRKWYEEGLWQRITEVLSGVSSSAGCLANPEVSL
jgi:transposase